MKSKLNDGRSLSVELLNKQGAAPSHLYALISITPELIVFRSAGFFLASHVRIGTRVFPLSKSLRLHPRDEVYVRRIKV